MLVVPGRRDDGFTLVEVLLALTLVVSTAVGVAELFAVSFRVSLTARRQAMTTVLAVQKMEQLRALAWRRTSSGAGDPTATDTTTDLSRDPPTSLGGGLAASPLTSLVTSTSGYADYLDAAGRWVGAGAVAVPRAVFVRRWNVQPVQGNADVLLLQVFVSAVVEDRPPRGAPGAALRRPGSAWLVSILARKAS